MALASCDKDHLMLELQSAAPSGVAATPRFWALQRQYFRRLLQESAASCTSVENARDKLEREVGAGADAFVSFYLRSLRWFIVAVTFRALLPAWVYSTHGAH